MHSITKYCPRCNKQFECYQDSITECKCFSINLSSEELDIIRNVYDDCICPDCLLEIKGKYKSLKENVRKEFLSKYIWEIIGNNN
ncbi:MAG: cysteine-rich CWC family protein [Ignavibacteria bacterium]|nr:cysteine-rich CWC family protein [Ignavibacteria bacterium]